MAFLDQWLPKKPQTGLLSTPVVKAPAAPLLRVGQNIQRTVTQNPVKAVTQAAGLLQNPLVSAGKVASSYIPKDTFSNLTAPLREPLLKRASEIDEEVAAPKRTTPQPQEQLRAYVPGSTQARPILNSAQKFEADRRIAAETGLVRVGNSFVDPTGVGGLTRKVTSSVTKPVVAATQEASKGILNSAKEAASNAFTGFTDLSTKTLEQLKGRTKVSKQFISDLTNSPDLKQAERDTIRRVLEDEGDDVDVPTFANKVKSELLPLTPHNPTPSFESVNLSEDLRGPVANYTERVYQSPIKTSAGGVHFSGKYRPTEAEINSGRSSSEPPNYFAHSRIEDLPPSDRARVIEEGLKKGYYASEGRQGRIALRKELADLKAADRGGTRRVIEIQSDLFQKGRLEQEQAFIERELAGSLTPEERKFLYEKANNAMDLRHFYSDIPADTFKKIRKGISDTELFEFIRGGFKGAGNEIAKLEPYRNTWHERVIREEVKRAAQDGKTKLQFPTGETAMKIEGLGEHHNWNWGTVDEIGSRDTLATYKPTPKEVGEVVNDGNTEWIITGVLGDGKFKAVPKATWDSWGDPTLTRNDSQRQIMMNTAEESFDISGKVDTENPIYKFYEKQVGKYLSNKYGAKRVKDAQGVEWWEIPVDKGRANMPVEAYGFGAGIEQDEEGNFSFNPTSALLGVAGVGMARRIKKPILGKENQVNTADRGQKSVPRQVPQPPVLQPKAPVSPAPNAVGATTPPPAIPPKAPPLPEGIPPESDPVKKIIKALADSKPLLRKQEAIYRAERARRVARIAAAGERVSGEQGYFAQLGAAKGELPRVQFESVRNQVTQADIDSLFNTVESSRILTPFEKLSAKGALAKLLDPQGGRLPTRGELQLMGEVFPPEFMKALLEKRSRREKVLEAIGEAINLPRALMATADLSAPLRQGIFLIGRPKQFLPAFKEMFKYAFNEKAYEGAMETIQARPTYQAMRESGLALTDMGKFMNKREEDFMSNLAEKIPGFGVIAKGSNRAYSGFLNKLRADTFDDLLKNAKALGIDKERPKVMSDIATFVNSATGRGDLGKLQKASVVLNGLFFSPRLLMSRLNLLNPVYYAKLDPFVRKEALKSLFTFAGTAVTVLTLANLAGAKVTADPRNSDFAKIRVGDTRYDVMGGFSQYIRLAAQLITGQKISSTTGKITTVGEGYKPLSRGQILADFAENKEAPVVSFVHQLLKGEEFGEPVDVRVEAANRAMPLMVQDMYDLAKEWGPAGILMGIPGVFGVGSMTYGNMEVAKGKNQLGQDTAQIRERTSLAQDAASLMGYKPPLETTSSSNVSVFYDELLKLPREEAARRFDEIATTNPELAEKILQEVADRQAGITPQDKALKSKGVANGERAIAVAKEFTKLKTNEEKAALWEEYVAKKIITKEVSAQLTELLK